MKRAWEEIFENVQRMEGKSDPRGMSTIFDDEITETRSAVGKIFSSKWERSKQNTKSKALDAIE